MPQTFDMGTPNEWELNECPYKFIDANTARLLQSSRDAENGHLPAVGGMLDQTPAFVESLRLIRRERQAYRKQQSDDHLPRHS